ncbi:hypothetical protein GWO43_25570, partial [candidate division KSB1 bacterium]|nr:hypothetical protein [candidate division KSB1 bacterium]NIR72573.1 hypothetical protein [candidate division KSB1 bacterium]NIS27325.1 hypothetical protein [candidate division KSB1 bacterium]NIT74181.1 hypothetical protein [candidate division KSB1 bacterium]NIU27407.1 hypothetical protein [candidate division KSB1 bacterium]
MKKLFFYSAWFGFLAISTSSFGAEKTKSAKEVLAPSSATAEFRLTLNNNFELNLQNVQSGENPAGSPNTRSVAKAVLLSAAIPGGGQIYNGSLLKSVAFLAV